MFVAEDEDDDAIGILLLRMTLLALFMNSDSGDKVVETLFVELVVEGVLEVVIPKVVLPVPPPRLLRLPRLPIANVGVLVVPPVLLFNKKLLWPVFMVPLVFFFPSSPAAANKVLPPPSDKKMLLLLFHLVLFPTEFITELLLLL